MRLVIATPFLETRGGMERVILKIAQRFSAKIHCVYYDPAGTFQDFQKLDVEAAKPGILSSLPVGRRVATAMDVGKHFYTAKLSGYDLINAHQTPSEWIRNRNSPVVWYCHTPNREAYDLYAWRQARRNPLSRAMTWASIQPFKLIESRTVPRIEHIFTNSRNSQERITKYLHRSSEVLHPGVDLDKFSLKAYENFFFYPSRIAPEKEIEYAIEAFKIFANRQNPKPGTGGAQAGTGPGGGTAGAAVSGTGTEAGKSGRWKLLIAGALSKRKEHQDYLKKLKSLCTPDISIETNVGEWQLRDLYSRCYAVLYTPVNEDYGLVPLEAMASSKPCIARNEGGPRETIIDGRDGYLVNSIWELAGKMESLSRDPQRCAEMGKAGRAKVERDFTWDAFLARFEAKALEIVEGKRPGSKP